MVSRIEQEAEVATVVAPESWAKFFRYGMPIVPQWVTLEFLEQQSARAAELQQLLGEPFAAEYVPNSTFGDDDSDEVMGHLVSIDVPALEAAFDLRDEDLREQLAEWLAMIAGKFNQARHRLLADRPQTAGDERVISLFEVVDVAGRILYRSLSEADCRDFQRAMSSRCAVRSRDALLCSPAAAAGGAA